MSPKEPLHATLSVEAFIEAAATSSTLASEQLNTLLAHFDAEQAGQASRPASSQTRRFVTALLAQLSSRPREEQLARYHLSLERLTLGNTQALTILNLPSTFVPEDWSYTFYEGIARYPVQDFAGKRICEIGCGVGWISIALARRALPARVLGLDINPKAVLCSQLNTYINAYDDEGLLILDAEGRSLLDRVHFACSDLLAYCRERGEKLDRIIGCIPQVLSPDPGFSLMESLDAGTDEQLYALSNYCGKQGVVEDQFGLGLVARAVEEAIERLSPGGKLIVNLGGRPGEAVLLRMFERRGLSVKRLWQRRIRQAVDTDTAPLVQIESTSSHRFSFFLDEHSKESVSARTATAVAKAGGRILHAIGVYEASGSNLEELREVIELVRRPDYAEARNGLDLAYDDEILRAEKIAFLGTLAQRLRETGVCFPYGSLAGTKPLRELLARYLEDYFFCECPPSNCLLAPHRNALVENLLLLYRPQRALIDADLAKSMQIYGWGSATGETKGIVYEAPRQTSLLCDMIARLRPELVVAGVTEFENETPEAFSALSACCATFGARLLVDITDFFDLSSSPQIPGALRYIAAQGLPHHTAIICGLEKNRIYREMSLGFLISKDREFLQALEGAAELTYSRAPLLSQLYYERILQDLLSFHVNRPNALLLPPKSITPGGDEQTLFPEVSIKAIEALAHPAVATLSWEITPRTARLDYGENALPTPELLKAFLFEGMGRQHIHETEADPGPETLALLQQRLGLASAGTSLYYANGVAPLFFSVAIASVAEGASMLAPQGCYGQFAAAARLAGASLQEIAGTEARGFKLSPAELAQVLSQTKHSWLYLNAPVVNPTGTMYTFTEIQEIIEIAARWNAALIIDAIFLGLEFSSRGYWRLDELFSRTGVSWVVLGGISKEFAAGGLRFGYAATRSPLFKRILSAHAMQTPPQTHTAFAMKKLYAKLLEGDKRLLAELHAQRDILAERAQRLTATLTRCGWTCTEPQGGLFLCAKPTAYIGKPFAFKDGTTAPLSASNINLALFEAVDLLINNDVWTGLPGYCRFVFSCESDVFARGLAAIEQFYALYFHSA